MKLEDKGEVVAEESDAVWVVAAVFAFFKDDSNEEEEESEDMADTV